MLRIPIPANELWDEKRQEFVYTDAQELKLEHSLVSISKWESTWCKPFLSKTDKTSEETLDYIKCMTLNKVDPIAYTLLSQKDIDRITDYIHAPMTATTFSEDTKGKNNRSKVTSEVIYWWMIALNIPFECQHWHLNRLLTLVRVCNIKNTPPGKKRKGSKELATNYAAINEARKKKLGTRG